MSIQCIYVYYDTKRLYNAYMYIMIQNSVRCKNLEGFGDVTNS